jgi:hypothetical protein
MHKYISYTWRTYLVIFQCTNAKFNRINITYLLRYPTHNLSPQPHIVCLLLFLHNTKIHNHNPLFISLFLQLNLLFPHLHKFFFIVNSLLFKCKGFIEPLLFFSSYSTSVSFFCAHIFSNVVVTLFFFSCNNVALAFFSFH